MKYIKGLLFILIAVQISLALFSIYEEYNGYSLCLPGFNCKAVQTSPYASIFGIKFGLIGAIAFTSLLLVYILAYNKKIPYWFFQLSIAIGTLGAVYFISVQAFILKTFCSTCMLIDNLMIAIGIIILIDYYLEKLR